MVSTRRSAVPTDKCNRLNTPKKQIAAFFECERDHHLNHQRLQRTVVFSFYTLYYSLENLIKSQRSPEKVHMKQNMPFTGVCSSDAESDQRMSNSDLHRTSLLH